LTVCSFSLDFGLSSSACSAIARLLSTGRPPRGRTNTPNDIADSIGDEQCASPVERQADGPRQLLLVTNI
jgi:hypothetical protein